MIVSRTAIALSALMRIDGVGRRTALRIVDGPIPETGAGGVPDGLAARVREAEFREVWNAAEDALLRGLDLGIRAFSFHDPGYPERFRGIPDPPAVLFVRGSGDGLHPEKAVAVVGTREPTPCGEKVAKSWARQAVEAGFVVVSGLARGCDTRAHEGCLEAGGVTVAVLAHGLDGVYPPENRGLADGILAAGGCLVAEYPAGSRPVRRNFVERDRLQSGLSDAVLLVETEIGGGAMHTARFARDQGRPVGCLDRPGHAGPRTEGNRKLVAEGQAEPIPDDGVLARFLDGLGRAAGGP